MKWWKKLSFLLAVIVAFSSCATKSRKPAADPGAIVQVLDNARISTKSPGMILGVLRPHGDPEVYASGVTDIDSDTRFIGSEHFFLGSVTKIFTATLVLDLAAEGTLELDDRLSEYVPVFPGADDISLRQLLNHTSGLADFEKHIYLEFPEEDCLEALSRDWTKEQMLELAGQLEPLSQPGESWEYSNTNYFLLALVVERATGQDFTEVLRSRILDPLGLDDTWLAYWEPARGEVKSTGYLSAMESWPLSKMFGELGPTTSFDGSNLGFGHSGLVSTLEDGLMFLSSLMKGEIIDDNMMEKMQSFVALSDAPAEGNKPVSGYGLGLFHIVRPGYEMLGHGGMFNGHTAGLWYFPACDTTIALYVNRGFIDEFKIYDELAEALDCKSSDDNAEEISLTTQSNKLIEPLPCKAPNMFKDRHTIVVKGMPLQIWGDITPEKLEIFEEGINAFSDQMSSKHFIYLFYGDDGPAIKFITTHIKNILLANKCLDEEYPEFGGPLFHPKTWTVYFSGENLGVVDVKNIKTLYKNHMVNIIHEFMHALFNRIGLKNSEINVENISSDPVFPYLSDKDPINGFVLHYYHTISRIFNKPEDRKEFRRIQQMNWQDKSLTPEEKCFFDKALPEITKHFVTVYSVSKYYEYFAEAGAAYFNIETGDLPDNTDAAPRRRRGMLKSTDPVLHLVLSRFFSSDTLDMTAFSIESFRKAYEDLGMQVPSVLLKHDCK